MDYIRGMGNLFRVCGILLIVGFLLPWYEVELKLGFLGKVKETFNGLGVARAGDLNFFCFLIPIMGGFVLKNPTRMNNAAAGLAVGLCLFLLKPSGTNFIEFAIGYWITLVAGIVLLLTFPFAEGE